MARLGEKEAALEAQAEEFVREKTAVLAIQADNFQKELNGLRMTLSAKENAWTLEKDKLTAAMREALSRAEQEMKDRAARLAAEYESKKT